MQLPVGFFIRCVLLYVLAHILRVQADFDQITTVDPSPYKAVCAHCMTPKRTVLRKEILDAMDQFLKVRGTPYRYFEDAADVNCNKAMNVTKIKQRRRCKHSDYCYSVTFSDGDGPPLTLRGCAEYFLPVAPLKDNGEYCARLTTQSKTNIDLVECACELRDLCAKTSSSSSNHGHALSYLVLLSSFIISCIVAL